MYAAALRPSNVLSLTVVEPPCAGMARGVPAVKALRAAGFPMLVVSGGHSEANEVICDTIAREAGAQRAVCRGRDHLVPAAPRFNDLLEGFLSVAPNGRL